MPNLRNIGSECLFFFRYIRRFAIHKRTQSKVSLVSKIISITERYIFIMWTIFKGNLYAFERLFMKGRKSRQSAMRSEEMESVLVQFILAYRHDKMGETVLAELDGIRSTSVNLIHNKLLFNQTQRSRLMKCRIVFRLPADGQHFNKPCSLDRISIM